MGPFLAHTLPRWAHGHVLLSNQGGAIGMLDQYTGYSDEMLEQMNSVSLIGGELFFFPYRQDVPWNHKPTLASESIRE